MYEESRITFTNNFFKNNANFSEKEIEKRSKELLKMFYEIVNNSNKN